MMAVPAIPAHIPPELVWNHNFDQFTAEGEDPFLALCRMHDLPPVVWSADASFGRPGWIVTRHEAMAEVLMDPARFAAERKGMIADLLGVPLRLNPIEIDPPAHHGYRRNLNPHFTPRAVQALEAAVRSSCAELIDGFAARGSCEFVHDFAIRFPTHVFLDLLALPRDRAADFLKWEDDLMRATDPAQRVAAARAIYAYLEQHKTAQQQAPANDLNQGIVTGEFEGRPLEHLEMMGMYYVLWVGGLDTVYSTLGWIMRHLANDPQLQDQLRAEPALIPAAVEELTRAFAVVVTHREVAQNCEFFGATLRKGDEINLPLALANRDPALFTDPHRIDITRKARHIGFGTGTHNCLGVHLAKRELRIVVEEFLSRFRNIRIAPRGECRHHTGRTFGMDRLPLEWDR